MRSGMVGRPTRPRRPDSGVIAILAILLVPVLLAFLGLVINMGHLSLARAQLQNAADAASLAAAFELNGTEAGLTRARDVALSFASAHSTTGGESISLNRNDINDSTGDIVLGFYDRTTRSFSIPDPLEPMSVNAVVVRSYRDGASGHNTPVWMALSSFLGSESTSTVRAEAMGLGGGPCESACSLPFVLASCQIVDDVTGNLRCGETLTFTSDGEDGIGITSLNLTDAATPEQAEEILLGTCRETQTGDSINMQNGNSFNRKVFDALLAAGYISEDPSDSNVGLGTGKEAAAPIVDFDCPNPRFNQAGPVLGFATFTVVRAQHGPGNYRSISISVVCDRKLDERSGCVNFGTTAPRVRLAR